MASWVATAAGGLVVLHWNIVTVRIFIVFWQPRMSMYILEKTLFQIGRSHFTTSPATLWHSVKGIGTNIRSISILILFLKTVRYWFVIPKIFNILNVFKCRLCAESQVYNSTCMTGNYRKCNWLSVCDRQDNIDFLLLRITVSTVLVWLQLLQGWTS